MPTTDTFSYTGSEQTWTVPSGVDEVVVECWGAGGGDGSGTGANGSGADGGYTQGHLDVTPGNTLYIYVGGAGGSNSGGFNGGANGGDDFNATAGGGGGASDVRQSGNTLSDRVVVAGGGGGGGSAEDDDSNPGNCASNGGSGGPDSASGGGGCSVGNAAAGGGGGGTQSSGGSGGNGDADAPGGDGALLDGGVGGAGTGFESTSYAGGGGGGGYYGGGGGAGDGTNYSAAGGGGGGSNYDDGLVLIESNTSGGGNAGDGQVSITYNIAPSAPSNLSVTQGLEDEIELSWSDNSTNESGFYVYRAQVSGSTTADYTQVANLAADTTTYTDTGLEDGERYYYRVSAYNSNGESELSNEGNATTVLPAPSGLTLDTSVEDEITASWTRNDDSSDGNWEVYRSIDGTLGSIVATITTVTTTSYTDTGLSDGEEYHYTVRRNTDHASEDSSQQSAVTVLPAPTNLLVSNITDTTADLSWTNNHDNGSETVQFKQSDNATWQDFSTGLALTTESETITGLLNGEEYDARVLAVTEHTTTEDV